MIKYQVAIMNWPCAVNDLVFKVVFSQCAEPFTFGQPVAKDVSGEVLIN